jgi:hypothetical protein
VSVGMSRGSMRKDNVSDSDSSANRGGTAQGRRISTAQGRNRTMSVSSNRSSGSDHRGSTAGRNRNRFRAGSTADSVSGSDARENRKPTSTGPSRFAQRINEVTSKIMNAYCKSN